MLRIVPLTLAAVLSLVPALPALADFIRGDSNSDLRVDLGDAVYTLEWLFLGGPDPECLDAADSNDSGLIDIADPIFLFEYLFNGGERFPEPFPKPGLDDTHWGKLSCRPSSSALHFDGWSDFVHVEKNETLQFGNQHTIAMWVRPDSYPGGTIFRTQDDYMIISFEGEGFVWYRAFGSQGILFSARQIPPDSWTHIACVMDMSIGQAYLYLDGVIDDGAWIYEGSNWTQEGFQLGLFGNGNAVTIDEFSIWSVALDQAAIQKISSKSLRGDEPGLVVYYNFDTNQLTDKVVYNRSPSGVLNNGLFGMEPESGYANPQWVIGKTLANE